MNKIELRDGQLAYSDTGHLINTRDYLLTKPFIKRYYDYNTKNTSAKNLGILFKKLGLKNYNEHLQIFNKELIGVDPWDATLSDNVKVAIIKECQMNHWYIYREILRVNNGADPFDINIFNYTAIYFMLRNIDFFLEASRQLGKTEVISTQCAIEFNFLPNIKIACAHYDAAMGMKNIDSIVRVIDALPSWMRFYNKKRGKIQKDSGLQEIKEQGRSASKKEKVDNELFDSHIVLKVVGQTTSKANNTGRGDTIPTWFIDETSHIKNNKLAFGALNQARKEAQAVARKNNRPFGYRLLGTPGKMESEEGRWMYNNIRNKYIPMNETCLEVLDMNEHEIREYAKTKSIDGIFHIKYDFDKVGKDANWFSERCQGEDVDGIRSELLLKWEDTSSVSPFPASELSTLDHYAETKISHTYNLRVHMPELTNDVDIVIYPDEKDLFHDWITFFANNYRNGVVVGLDVSRGLGGPNDNTVFSFVNPQDGRIIGFIINNSLEINDLTLLVKSLCEIGLSEGINFAFAIERNDGTSEALIQQLKYIPQVQPSLIPFPAAQWKLDNPLNTNIDYEWLDEAGNLMKSDFGLAINGRTRDRIMSLIQQLVRKYSRCICVPELISELKSLVVYTKKGAGGQGTTKIAAAQGKHDDVVMSVGHAFNALFYHHAILKRRHRITFDVKNWLINENTTAFTFSNRPASSRITVTLKEVNGQIHELFFDNKTRKYLTESEVNEVYDEEAGIKKDSYVSVAGQNINQKEEDIPEEEKRDAINEVLERSVYAAASKNVKVVNRHEYEMMKEGLHESVNVYNDNMTSIMNDFMNGL